MPVWLTVALFVASIAVSYILRPKIPGAPKPDISQLDVPQVSTSDPIPRVYGTKWITSANVVWYGDLKTVAIKEKGGKK